MPLNNSYDEQAVIQAIASALETFYEMCIRDRNKRRQTLKPLENKGFFCLSLLYRNGILMYHCLSAWDFRRYQSETCLLYTSRCV